MNKILVAMLSAAALCASCGGDGEKAGDDAYSSPPPADIAQRLFGTWQIAYEDEMLGFVKGTVYLDPEFGTAKLTLHNPANAGKIELAARSVVIDGWDVVVVLPPGSPSSGRPVEPVGSTQRTGTTIRLQLGEGKMETALASAELIDDSVRIRLRFDETSNTLSGRWTQTVDATAGRTTRGRYGFFRYGENGTAEMTGREIWQRPPPLVKTTYAIGEQFRITSTGPLWPYPFVVGSTDPAEDSYPERFLMVIGKHLPRNTRETIEIDSDDEDLHYRVYRTMDSYDGLPEGDSVWRDLAYEYLDKLEAKKQLPIERENDDEFLILHVDLRPGVLPGRKTFRINGVETEWLLRFGDHRVDMGFARDIKLDIRNESVEKSNLEVETVLTDFVYQKEEVYFEIRTHVPLPMPSLEFFIARNGKPLLFNERRELVAAPIADNPKIYRSPPVYLIQPGTRDAYPADALTIEVTNRDRLQVALSENVLMSNPSYVDAAVLESPTELRRAIRQQPAPDGLQWNDAVLRSAQCALSNLEMDMIVDLATNPVVALVDGRQNIERMMQLTRNVAIGNTKELSREEADVFVDYAPSNWGYAAIGYPAAFRMETSIGIGEHAGMLIIRQVLADLLRSSLPMYAGAMDDIEVLGLRDRLRPFVAYDSGMFKVDLGEIGINKVRIAAPDGHPWLFEMTYMPGLLKDKYGLEGESLVRYQIAATREARSKYADAMRTTIELAENIDDCDVYELSKLTGFGMGRVIEKAKASLMVKRQMPNGIDAWVADWPAQVRLDRVAHVSEALAAQEQASADSWNDLFLAVSIASLPVGELAAGTRLAYAAVVAATILDGSELAVSVTSAISQQWREETELEYALGASAIIGTRRFNTAQANDTSAWNIALAAAAGANDGYKIFRTIDGADGFKVTHNIWSFDSLKRGKDIAGSFVEEFDEMLLTQLMNYNLSMWQHHDLTGAMNHALGLEVTIGRDSMNPDELLVLKLVDRLVAESRDRPVPVWAAGFDEITLARLNDMVYRPDIAKIGEQQANAIAQIARDDTGFRVLHRPQTTLEKLQETIAEIESRPPRRGQRFVEQAKEPLRQRNEPANREGIFFSSKVGERRVVLDDYEGRREFQEFGRLVVSRVADPVLGTGKDLLRIESRYRSDDFSDVADDSRARIVSSMEIPYLDGEQGVPLDIVAGLRATQLLDFEFSDTKLGGLVLPRIRDARLIAELDWLRRHSPDSPLGELFAFTSAADDIKQLADQLGLNPGTVRITDTKGREVDPWQDDWDFQAPLAHLTDRHWLQSDKPSNFVDDREAFLALYDPDDNRLPVPYGYDIYIALSMGAANAEVGR